MKTNKPERKERKMRRLKRVYDYDIYLVSASLVDWLVFGLCFALCIPRLETFPFISQNCTTHTSLEHICGQTFLTSHFHITEEHFLHINLNYSIYSTHSQLLVFWSRIRKTKIYTIHNKVSLLRRDFLNNLCTWKIIRYTYFGEFGESQK